MLAALNAENYLFCVDYHCFFYSLLGDGLWQVMVIAGEKKSLWDLVLRVAEVPAGLD
ncbi:MAG: hypothetical protein NZ602_15815 [Thermoguttaceae bacterium]|nr:hypothetical protein [Thermoguttaceae bacterium]MDW8039359.1 hypothetical protein [Thermoguttaceae bacterium]